jgi:hypothetical protein
MTPKDQDREAVSRASDWLDDDVDPADAPATMAAGVNRRAYADQLFIDSSLREVFGDGGGESQRQIEQVLAKIREPVAMSAESGLPASSNSGRRSWIVSGLSLAAAIVGVGLLWLANEATTPTALAAVDQAKHQAGRPLDRHYRVAIDLAAIRGLNADLYLRGRECVALHVRGPLDVEAWIGSNGSRAWFAPKAGPVVVAHDFEPMRDFLAEIAGLPVKWLKVSDVLEALSRDYELELAEEAPVAELGPASWRRVCGVKQPGFRPLLPARIEFWADPQTGEVGKMDLDWAGTIENLAVERIRLILVDKSDRAADWYEHWRHHEPDRQVLDLRQPGGREAR